jgi:oligosaccharyltransferase complex subunit gamma
MRISVISLLALVPLLVSAATKSPEARFKKLLSKSISSAPIKLDDSSHDELTKAPRDFTAVVLMTALPAQFGCEPCKLFQPEYDVLAKSWMNGDKKGDTRVLFGALDFPDGKATFQKASFVQLDESRVPWG